MQPAPLHQQAFGHQANPYARQQPLPLHQEEGHGHNPVNPSSETPRNSEHHARIGPGTAYVLLAEELAGFDTKKRIHPAALPDAEIPEEQALKALASGQIARPPPRIVASLERKGFLAFNPRYHKSRKPPN
jgi:hypothetical protein